MRNREWFYSLKPREMVEWLDSEHVEDELRFADECRDPGVTGWWPDERDCMAEAAEVPSDSREKLEADARNLQERIWNAGANHDGISLRHILELLDRQAAITERETRLRDLYRFEENHRRNVRSIEEVNQQLNGRIDALRAEVDRLQRENVQLAHDLGECMGGRDYRGMCGKMLDVADELRRIAAVYDRDEGLA